MREPLHRAYMECSLFIRRAQGALFDSLANVEICKSAVPIIKLKAPVDLRARQTPKHGCYGMGDDCIARDCFKRPLKSQRIAISAEVVRGDSLRDETASAISGWVCK